MTTQKYRNAWLALVRILPEAGYSFADLTDNEDTIRETDEEFLPEDFKGAWANILIIAKDIPEALTILPLGLSELNFVYDYIDCIENVQSLLDDENLKSEVFDEVEWLYTTDYKFKISGRVYPFGEDGLDEF